jgi:hypothetical protein
MTLIPPEFRRPSPSSERVAWRSGFLHALQWVRPASPGGAVPRGLDPGNAKTGISGTLYASVFVWNIPAVACCPGASDWCLTHCYNADDRKAIFPVAEWQRNWHWVEAAPSDLEHMINGQLEKAPGPVAVRIHSSGDFYSIPYIRFWKTIIERNTTVEFWAYTRSWCNTELLQELEGLRNLSNVQLFASWDRTMPTPPKHWRTAYVVESTDDPVNSTTTDTMVVCPEQTGQLANCASCGFCIRDDSRSVLFYLH